MTDPQELADRCVALLERTRRGGRAQPSGLAASGGDAHAPVRSRETSHRRRALSESSA
jgi:hypothetical protein